VCEVVRRDRFYFSWKVGIVNDTPITGWKTEIDTCGMRGSWIPSRTYWSVTATRSLWTRVILTLWRCADIGRLSQQSPYNNAISKYIYIHKGSKSSHESLNTSWCSGCLLRYVPEERVCLLHPLNIGSLGFMIPSQRRTVGIGKSVIQNIWIPNWTKYVLFLLIEVTTLFRELPFDPPTRLEVMTLLFQFQEFTLERWRVGISNLWKAVCPLCKWNDDLAWFTMWYRLQNDRKGHIQKSEVRLTSTIRFNITISFVRLKTSSSSSLASPVISRIRGSSSFSSFPMDARVSMLLHDRKGLSSHWEISFSAPRKGLRSTASKCRRESASPSNNTSLNNERAWAEWNRV